jgi:endonuclease/exonuclease/phosphatase (EEP) superfamily protein YafD
MSNPMTAQEAHLRGYPLELADLRASKKMTVPRRPTLLFFAFLLVFGGAFLLAMRLTARHAGSAPPASAVWGVPDWPLRFVSYNVRHNQLGTARIIDRIRKLDPDFVLVQEVEREHLSTLTRELRAMPAVYHASENLAGARPTWGNAILSRYRLYEGKSIPNHEGRSLGVWATAAVEGKKFRVACVHLSTNDQERASLVKAWEDAGRPPIVLGVAINQPGDFNLTRDWSDALKQVGKLNTAQARLGYLLVSDPWKVIDGGAADTDPDAIWITAGKR